MPSIVRSTSNNYAYATVFAQVYKTLSADQKTRLAALRKSIVSGKYPDGTPFDYSLCATPFLAAVPIDLGAVTDQVYLSLYGTGIRGFNSLHAVSVTIGGIAVPVLWAGAQPQYPRLDQVNIGPLPRTLQGKGDTTLLLSVEGKAANAVALSIR